MNGHKSFTKYMASLKIGWQAVFWLALTALCLGGCDNSSSSGGPLGPSNTSSTAAFVQVTPASATVIKGDVFTFTATGGTGTFTWSVSDPTLASIVSTTGAFIAGNKAGTVTITATDSSGATGTASITISTKTLTIIPANSKVGKGASQTFIVNGATAPVFWSVNNTTIGSIDVNTGVFTAGISAGTTTVTVLDADGDTATATVEVIGNTIAVTPASISFSGTTPPATDPRFTATGGSGTFTFLLSGATNSYTGAAIGTVAGDVTPTSVLIDITAMPTGNLLVGIIPPAVCTVGQGTQTLTIVATDSNGDTGTAQLTLISTDLCTL